MSCALKRQPSLVYTLTVLMMHQEQRPVRSRPRRSCCARSATARPTGSCTSTRRTAAGSARSRRACGARAAASAAGWSRSSACDLVLHEGRGDLLTVTGAETVDGYPRLRGRRRRARRGRARLRRRRAAVRDRRAAPRGLPPALQRARAARRRARRRRRAPTSSRSASSCCSPPASRRSSPPARRAASASTSPASRARPAASSAARARRRASRSTRRPTRSWPARSARRSPRRRTRPSAALRQAERAIAETVEHHAGVRLRRAAAADRIAAPWETRTVAHEVGLRLRRGLARHARPARRQGRERRRDDADPRRRARARGLHDHDRGVRRLHGRRRAFPDGLDEQVAEALARLEEQAGKTLGDADDPLLVSVRSGARESMPGMLDTVLNLGLNDESVEGLAEQHRQRALRLGLLPALRADVRQRRARASRASASRTRSRRVKQRPRRRRRTPSSTSTRCASSIDALQGVLPRRDGEIPAGPAGAAARRDPRGLRLLDGRARGRLPAHQPHPRRLGHGGQRPADGLRQQGRHVAARGVAFSRDEVTGAPEPSGDFLLNAQGEDVVSGVRNTRDIAELADVHARRRTRS